MAESVYLNLKDNLHKIAMQTETVGFDIPLERLITGHFGDALPNQSLGWY